MVRGVGNDSPSLLSRPLPDIAPALDRSPRSSWPTWGIVVVLCQNGLAIPLSTDHKPNLPSERERIVRAGGTVDQQDFGGLTVYRVNGNLNLSRSLGDLDCKRNAKLAARDQVITSFPDLIEKKRERHDEFLLIASDGIWDRISNQDAVDMVLERLAGNEEARLSSITEALVERRGGC